MAVTRSERISWLGLLAFSSPVLMSQAIDLATRVYMPSYLAATVGLPVATVGLLLMGERLIISVLGPMIGWASDRYPTAIGHRRPWLLVGAPIVVAGATGLFWAKPGIGLIAALIWLLLLQLGHSLIGTALGGWALELSPDPNERVRIMATKIWLACVGTVATLLLPGLLDSGLALNLTAQVRLLGTSIALLAPVTVLLVICSVREPRTPATIGVNFPLGLFASILRDPALQPVLVVYALVGLGEAATTCTFLFLINDALRLEGYGSTLLLIPAIVPLIGLPIWTHFSRLLGKRDALRLAFGWEALITPIGLLLPAGALLPLVVWLVLRHATTGVDYTLLRALMADVTRHEVDHGIRWGASRHAVFNMVRRLTFALGIGASLVTLSLGGYEAGGVNDNSELTVVRLIHVLPASMAALLAYLLLRGRSDDSGSGPLQKN